MPFIHIKSLPFDPPIDAGPALMVVSREFAAATGVDLEHVTATWEFLAPHHYAVAGETAASQVPDSHPVLVDLLAPDFNSPETVQTMLEAVAQSIARVSGVASQNVFVNYREAHAGQVLDAGEIVRW